MLPGALGGLPKPPTTDIEDGRASWGAVPTCISRMGVTWALVCVRTQAVRPVLENFGGADCGAGFLVD
eukprot:1144256-Pelagomonas_calceolata.AAC.6